VEEVYPQGVSSRCRSLLILLLLCTCIRAQADYNLPGTADTAGSATGDNLNNLHQVAQDSSGYWYVVWETSSQTDILMAYTTTSTPTAATDWALVTLVDNAGGGIIAAAPANSQNGRMPSIGVDLDDRLYLLWRSAANTQIYTTWCSSLTALTTSANWSTPISVGTGISDYSFVLDGRGVPHLAGNGDSDLVYTKFDTASGAWLAGKGFGVGLSGMSMAAGIDDDLYIAYTVGGPEVLLIASMNATSSTVNPSSSVWSSLTSTADGSNDSFSPDGTVSVYPAICVDACGVVHLAWSDVGNSGAIYGAHGIYGRGFYSGTHYLIDDNHANKYGLCWIPVGRGDAYLLFLSPNTFDLGEDWAYFYALLDSDFGYRAHGLSTDTDSVTAYSNLQYTLILQNPPRDGNKAYFFFYDSAIRKIRASSSYEASLLVPRSISGFAPPRQNRGNPHPHLNWVFPRTAVTLGGQPTVPIVSHGSKSAVYLAESAGATPQLYAVDRTTGSYARSYALSHTASSIAAATFSGNVHLFLQSNGGRVLAMIDNGTAMSRDPAWANNPCQVANATGGILHSLAFYMEGTTRYLYGVGSVDPVNVGVWKLYADSGNVVTGFPQGIAYAPNGVESVLRVINDNVYTAGNISQVYRRSADGTGETFSSGVLNAVRHLMLVRTNNDLFVAPTGNRVYRLTSDLLTSTWTSGQSADLAPLTSGAQFNPAKSFVFVGAGNQLYKVNVTDGTIISNTPMETAGNIVSLPYQWKSYVYFGTDTGKLYAVNASDPTVARANWPVNVLSNPTTVDKMVSVVIDGPTSTLYAIGSVSRRVYRFSLE